jgi:energy-coupling factor transporter ATP-binding protein EcfA2
MADVGSVMETARLFCSDVRQLRSDILVADYYNDRLAGKLVFDCREDLFGSLQGFQQYQDDLLRDEYYASGGALKWSIYLLLVRSAEQCAILQRSGLAQQVERDLTYARKLVIPEKELERELASRFFGSIGDRPAVMRDAVHAWMERLQAADLAGVYMDDQPMDVVVEHYMGGTPIQGESEPLTATTSSRAAAPAFIQGLRLNRYRPCLANQTFAFGRVNLITGPNGSGKTSLLEAIELWMCERSRRNPSDREAVDQIGIKFEDQGRFAWNHALREKEYRRRALDWYGIHRARGNVVHNAFGRFNFLDADAATRLSETTTKAELMEALDGIVLGREAGVVLERARKIRERFQQQGRMLEAELMKARARATESEQQLQALSTQDAQSSAALKALAKALKAQGWKGTTTPAVGDLDVLASTIDGLASAVHSCREGVGARPDLPLRNAQRERTILTQNLPLLAAGIQERVQAQKELQQLSPLLLHWQDVSGKMNRLRDYTADRSAARLLGLGARIADCERTCTEKRSAFRSLEKLDTTSFEQVDGTFTSAAAACERDLVTKRHELAVHKAELELQEAKSRISVSRLDALLGEAAALVAAGPLACTCPVCGAPYRRADLQRRIEAHRQTHTRNEPLVQTRARTLALEREVSSLEKKKAALDTMQKAAGILLQGQSPARVRVASFAASLHARSAHLTRQSRDLEDDQAFALRMRARGLNEGEYAALVDWLRVQAPQLTSGKEGHGVPDPQACERYARTVHDNLEANQNRQKTLDLMITENRTALRQIVARTPAVAAEPSEALRELRAYSVWLDALVDVAARCSEVLATRPTTTIDELETSLDSLGRAITRTVKAREADHRARLAAQLRRKAQAKLAEDIERTRAGIERAGHASDALGFLVTDELERGESATDFFRQNTEQVSELFQALCMPRDFVGVRAKANGLVATRRGSHAEASITHLSSGQRAALALAVFLSLNSWATDAPPYILLDDPVSHADDLHVLNLLDLLRVVARRGSRQVFFATSNVKVASLFERKFAYLNDEFQVIRLPAESG